ncbi:Transcriptional regulatory protein DegU [compost metagenome]
MNITEREREIIHLLSKGMSNKQIGQQLGISHFTVRDHLSAVFKKLNITNRFELIVMKLTSTDEHPA